MLKRPPETARTEVYRGVDRSRLMSVGVQLATVRYKVVIGKRRRNVLPATHYKPDY